MVSVASLLNPLVAEACTPISSPSLSSSASTHAIPLISNPYAKTIGHAKKGKMVKDAAIFTKGKLKGMVNFPPFQDFDEEAAHWIKKYRIFPATQIEDYPRHIPYNSEKKSFLDKTGRESFEVFQYVFSLPGEDKEYTVMWDYNVGLVRITPFFKCLRYSKTTPAKMLGLNHGLKDITHSITGGALAAQGYWMPYECALSVCLTFCDPISGALIPIFGPTFPARCVSQRSPAYGRMVIEQTVISNATRDAHAYREHYTTSPNPLHTPVSRSPSVSPRAAIVQLARQPRYRETATHLPKRLRLKRHKMVDSLHGNDTDTASVSSRDDSRYLYSPVTPPPYGVTSTISFTTPDWRPRGSPTSTNSTPRTPLPNSDPKSHMRRSPLPLAAGRDTLWADTIPRSIKKDMDMHAAHAEQKSWLAINSQLQRSNADTDSTMDDGYDGEESASGSDKETDNDEGVSAEKKAAKLLMKLSVKDGGCVDEECKEGSAKTALAIGRDENGVDGADAQQQIGLKRKRAMSF